MRLDEAEDSFRKVILQVAASADTVKEAEDDLPSPNRLEVRSQAADARRGLESARAQLQELHDKLEEQGNFVACEQINALYGSLAGAAGGIEGVEQLLDKPRPQRRPHQVEFYAMDAGATNVDANRGPTPPAPMEGGQSGTEQKTNHKGSPSPSSSSAVGTNRGEAKHNAQGNSGGTRENAATPTQAAEGSGGRQAGRDGSSTTLASALAGGGGGVAAAIRFGGATTDEQERGLLRTEAEQALEQARIKFQGAGKGQDTDNAALLYAHQLVLTKIGSPTTLEERQAYERWRSELGASLEQVAAERLRDGGAYW